MSTEGVTLVAQAGLVLYLIVAGAVFRTWIGTSRRRGEILLAGTIGGLSCGVFVAWLTSADASALGACLGMTAGWAVSWWFARRSGCEARA